MEECRAVIPVEGKRAMGNLVHANGLFVHVVKL